MNTATAAHAAGRALRSTFTGPGATARTAGALLVLGTLCCQHPNQTFNRVVRRDYCAALFPNWRFFAPNPAQHDYHFFYRTLSVDGETSDWTPVEVIVGRKPQQIFWFPDRRAEKGVFDLTSDLLPSLEKGFGFLKHLPSYRMLVAYLRKTIADADQQDVKGFQFTLARSAGYDESEEPDVVFVSPYTPLRPPVPAAGRHGPRPVVPTTRHNTPEVTDHDDRTGH